MTEPTAIELDLNQTIVSAVNARIEAEMMKALSGDETIATFVTAALRQKVEVKNARTYTTTSEPFLTNVLRNAIQEVTKAACKRLVEESMPDIEAEIAKALRRDVKRIASTLTESLSKAADKAYGFDVHLELKMPIQ